MNSVAATYDPVDPTPTDWKAPEMQRRIRKRYASERRFKALSLLSVSLALGFLAFLLFVMLSKGLGGFTQTRVALPIDQAGQDIGVTPDMIAFGDQRTVLASGDFRGFVADRAASVYGAGGEAYFSENSAIAFREMVADDPDLLTASTTVYLPASSTLDLAAKGDGSPAEEALVDRLDQRDALRSGVNWDFLTGGDATDPARAGIWGALKGSLLTMLVTLAIAFPIGVLSALYLEEYAPRNRWTDMIEVSINNLAAVPSIIFGLLALAVFINVMHLPASSPLVGGLTLALMTMPVIVIAGRNAIKGVPPSIRDAALGIGASPIQVVFHHVLPLALPGILTGTIIGMARALGETAPLLLIGMRAFIADPPSGVTDPATVLPMQIYLWSDEVDGGFVEKTSAAIIVLLVVLLSMNAIAVYLRNRFEKRW